MPTPNSQILLSKNYSFGGNDRHNISKWEFPAHFFIACVVFDKTIDREFPLILFFVFDVQMSY